MGGSGTTDASIADKIMDFIKSVEDWLKSRRKESPDEPKLSLKVLRGETVIKTDELPEEIFVNIIGGECYYYINIDEKESNRFDKVIIECDNGIINGVKMAVRSFSSDSSINEEKAIDKNDYKEVSDFNDDKTICNITKYIVNIMDYDNEKYAGTSEVPSKKKCTIKVKAKVISGKEREEDIFPKCTEYTVWKKITSYLYEDFLKNYDLAQKKYKTRDDITYENFGDRLTEKKIAGHFETEVLLDSENRVKDETEARRIAAGAHLFYYSFKYPNANTKDMRQIDIYKSQRFLDIHDSAEETKFFDGGKNRRAHKIFRECLLNAIQRADDTQVTITFKNDSQSTRKVYEIGKLSNPDSDNEKVIFDELDTPWVVRFIEGRQYVSAHCFGLAVDINYSYYFNKQESPDRWNEIESVLSLITYTKCETITKDGKTNYHYYFSCSSDLDDNANKYEKGNRHKFGIANGKALVNWLLYHLAFKPTNNIINNTKWAWGGYFGKGKTLTDAMHFSIVESASEKDITFPAYPPPLEMQSSTFDNKTQITTYNITRICFCSMNAEANSVKKASAFLKLEFDNELLLSKDNIKVEPNTIGIGALTSDIPNKNYQLEITGDFMTKKEVTVSVISPPSGCIVVMPNGGTVYPPKHSTSVGLISVIFTSVSVVSDKIEENSAELKLVFDNEITLDTNNIDVIAANDDGTKYDDINKADLMQDNLNKKNYLLKITGVFTVNRNVTIIVTSPPPGYIVVVSGNAKTLPQKTVAVVYNKP